MAEERSHKIAANRIAKKFGTETQSEGPDIKTPKITVEVETATSVQEGCRGIAVPFTSQA